ncbi:AAA family ATPase [Sutcliffiella rhizosphaerae]|uniref:Holliday junction ATP-dependent DNA helicase RuvB n=1 Tax=Sutcliffiella rhizosphaerae TaxID=2880967 RepID=A0ABN8AD73_9BACI|nr:AAA family ATPase [Sutcliffiella rhizosphaerae]CAG9623150.1 Holliday junction ATP-dependent DNA helicase RuvB [Sutcliffiella rhizosphaerae]
MKTKIVGLLKFLFPEWQIYDDYKKHGLISKNYRKSTSGNQSRIPQSTGRSNPPIASENRAGGQGNVSAPYQTASRNNSMEVPMQTSRISEENINIIFRQLYGLLGSEWIGQRRYLESLSIAFKRPFVTGMHPLKPKNSIFIFGHKGSGRKSSVTRMASLLKDRRLVQYETVSRIDLASYTTATEYQLFLSDLYKSLYAKSDIVLFENIEKAPSNVVDTIAQLTRSGTYTLSARYTQHENRLMDATGVLDQQTISEIHANQKYFVFLSERKEKDAYHMFGSDFMDAIGDLIHIDPFTEAEIQQIGIRILENLKAKCASDLAVTLSYDPEVSQFLAKQFKTVTGISGLNEIAEQHIYQPISEVKLKSPGKIDEYVHIKIENEKYVALTRTEMILLENFLRGMKESSIADIKKELEQIVGIDSVKDYILKIEDNLKIQQLRESKGFSRTNISMHMVFTGNPGTGKTTIARIVAKYLKAIGVLSTGQLREVTRADLVGEYVGQTARLTNDVIKSALGGVLFIDEAYTLSRNEHDTFGIEAIDTLVKGMEDYRDELVVILAGYSEEMKQFLNTNPGLRSRFPNIVQFEDYTPDEMWEISRIISKQKGYRITDSCKDAMLKLFEKSQIKGKNDSGNGRLVRNIIEAAILKQSSRLIHETDAPMDELTYEDFAFEDNSKFDLEARLSQVVGLENVKQLIRTQQNLLIAEKKRREAGLKVDATQSLHMIFSGNPGTGKTTVARIMANMFKEMGLLKSGNFVEVDSGGLTGEHAGQTSKKTEEIFRSALGGVLFIDEAYGLASNTGYGQEAVNTLVKLMEDHREDIVVILAGYNKEMKEFLKSNSGLESRFPLQVNFPDYTDTELFDIAKIISSSKGFILTKESEGVLKEQIAVLHKQSSRHSGNGRMVRNYLEEITRNQSLRIAMADVAVEEMNVILPQDIKPTESVLKNYDLETALASIAGLEEVKNHVRSLHALLRIQAKRKKLGLPVDENKTLHMIFTGNPGTGKTMMARVIANVLYSLGIIKANKLVETDRSGLVAGFVGQTAIKTREVIEEAMDGVLFIDEAYALAQGGAGDFGKEAIDTLVKMMDDHRDRLVVILAGYTEDMERFLSVNSGLKSRFPTIIEFPDYELMELMEIAQKFYNDHGFKLTVEAVEKLEQVFIEGSTDSNFGNGRYVRNVYERSLNLQASRLSNIEQLTEADLTEITAEDIERV